MVNSIHGFVYGLFRNILCMQSEYAFCFGNFIKEVGLRFFSSCVGGGILLDYCNTVCLCYCRDLFFSVHNHYVLCLLS
jgi:hypothetical protein